MSLRRKMASQKPVTILHAVPETPESETALRPVHQERHTQPSKDLNQVTPEKSSDSLPSSQPDSTTTSIPPYPITELKLMFSNTPRKSAISTYKHGRVQWRYKDINSLENSPRAVLDRTLKPKIQVTIPRGTRDRPLPGLPFFGNPIKSHSRSNSAEVGNTHNLSASQADNQNHNSGAPSRGHQRSQSLPCGELQSGISHNVSRSSSTMAEQDKIISEAINFSSDSQEDDSSSTYSSQSSQTSAEEESAPIQATSPAYPPPRSSRRKTLVAGDNTRHHIAPSLEPPRRYAHHMSSDQDLKFQPTCDLELARRPSDGLSRKPTLRRKSSKRGSRRSLASNSNMGVIHEAVARSTSRQLAGPSRVSPTLSEAENELQEQLTLTAQSQECSFKWDAIDCQASPYFLGEARPDSSVLASVDSLPPSLPRRSSKRNSGSFLPTSRLSYVACEVASPGARTLSQRRNNGLTIEIPEYKILIESTESSSVVPSSKSVQRTITPGSAEAVILNILHSLEHLDDLFSTAVLNRGFYRVFKRHELDLIKSTVKKMSPAAWEFREIAYPGHDLHHAEDLEITRPQEEYTPSTYLQLHKQDIYTIRAIKLQIKASCQSFVRPEISVALASENPLESARVDNALWRIWTFCKIFGSGKAREEDIVAQIDWLKGGPLVHQKVSFSIMSTDYMNDTLVSAPDCFAKGNEDGLTAEQLFDIMEIWNCLGVLLRGFEGRTSQAREAGIFDNTDIRGGDIDGEEMMLDEWCYYLLTFGPATVLDIASSYRQPNCSPFKLASEKGWANWKAPTFGGTRRNFLKEAASRVYEDKIAHTYAATSTRDVQRQQSKVRIQKHITELRKRKNSGERVPMISMSEERPMSECDAVIGNLTRPVKAPAPGKDIVSYIPTLRSALAQEVNTSITELPADRSPPPRDLPSSPPRRTVAQPLLPSPPPSTVPSNRDRNSMAMSMASIDKHPEYRKDEAIPEVPSLLTHPIFLNGSLNGLNGSTPPAFQQHPTQRNIYSSRTHENTADKAIYRIVEMGFTADQAREALRMTDLGDGLRVDRAVDLLLSGRFPRRS